MLETTVHDEIDTVIKTYYEDPADNDRGDAGTITQQNIASTEEDATSTEEVTNSQEEDAALNEEDSFLNEDAVSKEEDENLRKEVIEDPILCAIREYCVKNMQRFKLVKALYQGAQGNIEDSIYQPVEIYKDFWRE
jgi:hypothetical protein